MSRFGPDTGQAIRAIRRVPTTSRFDAPYGRIAVPPPAAIIESAPAPVDDALLQQVRKLIQSAEAQAPYFDPTTREALASELERIAASVQIQSAQASVELRAAAARIRALPPGRPPPGPPGSVHLPLRPPPPPPPPAPPTPATGQVLAAQLSAPPRRAPSAFMLGDAALEAFNRGWEQGLPPKALRALWRSVRTRAVQLFGRYSDPGERPDWDVYERWWRETHPAAPARLGRVSTGQAFPAFAPRSVAALPEAITVREPAPWISNLVNFPQGSTSTSGPRSGESPVSSSRTGQLLGPDPWATVGATLAVAGTGLGAFHGYRRTGSVGWAIAWAILGGLFPIITLPIAYAQGFAKPDPSFRGARRVARDPSFPAARRAA